MEKKIIKASECDVIKELNKLPVGTVIRALDKTGLRLTYEKCRTIAQKTPLWMAKEIAFRFVRPRNVLEYEIIPERKRSRRGA